MTEINAVVVPQLYGPKGLILIPDDFDCETHVVLNIVSEGGIVIHDYRPEVMNYVRDSKNEKNDGSNFGDLAGQPAICTVIIDENRKIIELRSVENSGENLQNLTVQWCFGKAEGPRDFRHVRHEYVERERLQKIATAEPKLAEGISKLLSESDDELIDTTVIVRFD